MNDNLILSLRTLRNEIAHGIHQPEALAKRIHDLGISIPPDDIQWFATELMRGFHSSGEHFVPSFLIDVISLIIEGRSANIVVDPWAGFGVLASTVQKFVQAKRTLACNTNYGNSALARVLSPHLDWHTGDPLEFINGLTETLDVVASVLPFGMRISRDVAIKNLFGESISGTEERFNGDLGQIILVTASMRLSSDGIGLFVVPPSFFFTQRSTLHDLPKYGLGIEAALALPAGSFSPYTSIPTYLIVVKKQVISEMFVAQLSQDIRTNQQIISNMIEQRVDGTLELGRLVKPTDFRGIEPLRLNEQFRKTEDRYSVPAMSLDELSKSIKLGRPGDDFNFPDAQNALYIPLIGLSDVIETIDDMTLKKQNYAQVVIDKERSDARFVAHFLNSELGRSMREMQKSGVTIQKLNTTGLKGIQVFIPNLGTQNKILEIETKLETEKNTLLSLQNDLASMRRELWSNPKSMSEVDSHLNKLSKRLSVDIMPQAAISLDQWFETLPFPLASILRAWQATSSLDYKTRYEHLLHFFEAAAEFISVILLSAFSSNIEFFSEHRTKLITAWKKQNISLERASFGTWKIAVEYLGKQTRNLLSAEKDKRSLCAEIFADPSLDFAQMLSNQELAAIISAGNKMRNDWSGHGGIVGESEAKLRNEKLLSEVHKLRDIMADSWTRIEMIQCLGCKPRRGKFDNEVAILKGSNSEFLKETRPMSSWLDVERLYLISNESDRPLLLLPLVNIGPSPNSAKNACYFYSRVEQDGLRFVSYHYVDQSERKDKFDDASNAISFLTNRDSVII